MTDPTARLAEIQGYVQMTIYGNEETRGHWSNAEVLEMLREIDRLCQLPTEREPEPFEEWLKHPVPASLAFLDRGSHEGTLLHAWHLDQAILSTSCPFCDVADKPEGMIPA